MPKLNKAQLRKYRRHLQEILSHLGVKVENMEQTVLREEGDVSSEKADEFGSLNYTREFQLGLIENEEEILREVHQALMRVDEGTYGICERCEQPIPPRRLEVLPYARYCVECKRKLEEGEGDQDL
ncbi:MAG: TraR/DksA family transcriptional regulator [Planctomycetota bacterium]